MRSLFLYLTIITAAGSLTSCRSGAQVASGNGAVKKMACGKVEIETDVPHIDWFEESNTGLAAHPELNPPKAYKVYTLESSQLKRFFEAAADGNKQTKTVVPLNGAVGCRVFSMKRSGTIPKALAEKYPGLVSLSGNGVEGMGDIRLDYDGNKMNGQVIWKEEVYLIAPVEYDRQVHYIVYKKSDSNVEKEAFESETK